MSEVGMMDREKVIKGLQGVFRCVSPVTYTCGDCPYQDNRVECIRRVLNDALALLKAQEPRVMTLEEVDALGDNAIVWLECLYFIDGKNTTELKPAIYQSDNSSPEEDGYYCVVSSWSKSGFYHKDSYMSDWRCWTSRPDEKRRAETPWE